MLVIVCAVAPSKSTVLVLAVKVPPLSVQFPARVNVPEVALNIPPFTSIPSPPMSHVCEGVPVTEPAVHTTPLAVISLKQRNYLKCF